MISLPPARPNPAPAPTPLRELHRPTCCTVARGAGCGAPAEIVGRTNCVGGACRPSCAAGVWSEVGCAFCGCAGTFTGPRGAAAGPGPLTIVPATLLPSNETCFAAKLA